MPIPVHVIHADWQTYADQLREIRQIVFIQEQDVPQELEWDNLDDTSTHFLAVNELGQYLGCARLLESGQIGRMAVLNEHRSHGVGALLLNAAVEHAKLVQLQKVFLHAQTHAEPFYRKGGFLPYGRPFMEAGIEHIAMEMQLPIAFDLGNFDVSHAKPIAVKPQAVPPRQLAPSHPSSFTNKMDASSNLVNILSNAKRQVQLLHPNLDQDFYDNPDIANVLSQVARSAANVQIRILIMDVKLIVDRGHSLLELARRLDQKIKIRVLDETANPATSSFCCVDQQGYWLLPSWEKFEGVSDHNNPVTCNRLLAAFESAWEKSKESSELRQLQL